MVTDRKISNEDLQIADIPSANASFEQIIDFCNTYFAYEIWGDKCYEIARAGGPDTLDKLRTELFLFYRMLAMEGDPVSQWELEHMRSILDRIRALLNG